MLYERITSHLSERKLILPKILKIMIQRIQSIFLLLASGSLGSLFMNPVAFANFSEPTPSVPASADGLLNMTTKSF